MFETGDDRAHMKLQLGRLDQTAKPGVAFSLVQKLLAFNDAHAQRVEVVILSRNDPVSGMRVFRSAQHYGLPIQRGSFTGGQPPWRCLKPLLEALHRLQTEGTSQMRVRSALVTARSAPAHKHAIRTLVNWNIGVDEAMFLGGLPKGGFLREFEPDFFFDDQTMHIEHAFQHVPSGHVASGVSNG